MVMLQYEVYPLKYSGDNIDPMEQSYLVKCRLAPSTGV